MLIVPKPVSAPPALTTALESAFATELVAAPVTKKRWTSWMPKLQAVRKRKQLRLVETLPLGDRRFVAVVEANGRQLLIGATPQSMSLLTDLGATAELRS